jgi:beta-glucanase (GH16 family)
MLLSGCADQASQYTYTTPVWSDEFDATELDTAKWYAMTGTGPGEGYPEYWGNDEKQFYRAENAAVRDGHLVIQINREEYGGMGYTSARLTTAGLYAFTYGRVEARMKLPSGADGLWPAFWLLPDGKPDEWIYGTWAASGEIDIMENRSRQPGEVGGAAHFGGMWPANTSHSGSYAFPGGGRADGWHIYTLEWFPHRMIWYVDGEPYLWLNDWYTIVNGGEHGPPEPFDRPFCIIVNGTVGGNFDGGREPSEDFTNAEILVDWVRVYQ